MEDQNQPITDDDKYVYGNVKRLKRQGLSISDADFVGEGRIWQQLFADYLPQFTAFDPQLDSTYADQWLQELNRFSELPSDETMRDLMVQAQLDSVAAQQAAMTLADDVAYYVKKAYPKDERKADEFGFKLMRKQVAKPNIKFALYGFTLHRVYERYATALLAAGLPAGWEADYLTAIENSAGAHITHEWQKRERIRATTERVEVYNTLNSLWERVQEASRVIFREQEELRKLWQKK
ncbi:MAG: hypothetical protein IPH78_01545 [Bacteroidetes bacterium]|nr:hypothetical protein [Bacteroidota bacterium]